MIENVIDDCDAMDPLRNEELGTGEYRDATSESDDFVRCRDKIGFMPLKSSTRAKRRTRDDAVDISNDYAPTTRAGGGEQLTRKGNSGAEGVVTNQHHRVQ